MNENIVLEKMTIESENGFSLEGILIINHKLEIKHIEEQLKHVLGFEKDEVTFTFFTNPSSEFRMKLADCFLNNTPCCFRQYVFEREKWFKCYVFPFENNFIIHFSELSYLLDLEHKFSALLDSTTDFNVLVGLDYHIVSFNKSSELFAKDVLQKDLKIGDSILEYIPLSAQEDFTKDFESAIMGNFFTHDKKVIYNEKVSWFRLTFMPYYFQNSNQIKGISFNSVDITNIINTKEIIEEKESIINEVFSKTDESYLFISKDLQVLYKNDAVDLIYPIFFGGLPKIGEHALSFINNEKQVEFKEFYLRVLNGATIQFHRNEGGNFWRILLFPVYNNSGELIGIAIRIQDITTQKLNEKKIKEQDKKLDEIVWHHSHVVRKPLANILGIYDVLKNNEIKDDKVKENYLVHLYAAAKELDTIINNVVESIRGN